MFEYKFKRRNVSFKHLNKRYVDAIKFQLGNIKNRFGELNSSIIESLNHGCSKQNNYYKPYVSSWDSIKENDDICLVELDLDIENKDLANEIAFEIKKYIICLLLDNELNIVYSL